MLRSVLVIEFLESYFSNAEVADPPAPAPGAPEGLLMMGTAADIAAGKVRAGPEVLKPILKF